MNRTKLVVVVTEADSFKHQEVLIIGTFMDLVVVEMGKIRLPASTGLGGDPSPN